MMLLPAQSAELAAAISAAIYALTRPESDGGRTTQYAVGWREAGGRHYLEWPLTLVLPVHPARGPAGRDALAGLVQAGVLLPSSAAALELLVQARSGASLTLDEATPPEWRAALVAEDSLASA